MCPKLIVNRILGFLQRNLKNDPTHLKQLACIQTTIVLPSITNVPLFGTHITREMLKGWKLYNVKHALCLTGPGLTPVTNKSINEMLSVLKWPLLQAHRKNLRLLFYYLMLLTTCYTFRTSICHHPPHYPPQDPITL